MGFRCLPWPSTSHKIIYLNVKSYYYVYKYNNGHSLRTFARRYKHGLWWVPILSHADRGGFQHHYHHNPAGGVFVFAVCLQSLGCDVAAHPRGKQWLAWLCHSTPTSNGLSCGPNACVWCMKLESVVLQCPQELPKPWKGTVPRRLELYHLVYDHPGNALEQTSNEETDTMLAGCACLSPEIIAILACPSLNSGFLVLTQWCLLFTAVSSAVSSSGWALLPASVALHCASSAAAISRSGDGSSVCCTVVGWLAGWLVCS